MAPAPSWWLDLLPGQKDGEPLILSEQGYPR